MDKETEYKKLGLTSEDLSVPETGKKLYAVGCPPILDLMLARGHLVPPTPLKLGSHVGTVAPVGSTSFTNALISYLSPGIMQRVSMKCTSPCAVFVRPSVLQEKVVQLSVYFSIHDNCGVEYLR